VLSRLVVPFFAAALLTTVRLVVALTITAVGALIALAVPALLSLLFRHADSLVYGETSISLLENGKHEGRESRKMPALGCPSVP